MRSKLILMLVVALAVGLMASSAFAQAKLLCVSNQELKGEQTVAQCVAKGDRFAIVDQFGIVRILTPEEVELTKAFNPKAFEARAFGIKYEKLAPPLAPLPVPGRVTP